jgi:hypothetical protein
LEAFEEVAETPLAERATTMRDRGYAPKRFKATCEPTKPMGADVEVPPVVAFAAKFMIDALDRIANGKPLIPTLVPNPTPHRGQPHQLASMSSVDSLGAVGLRGAQGADLERIAAAFRALVGVPPERFWEVILDRALTVAIATRSALPIQWPEVFEIEGQLVTRPNPPTAADVLAVVNQYSAPGSVPDWVNERLIEAGLERCTDARGGGRGTDAAKLSVHQWLGHIKNEITNRRRGNSKK